VQPRSEVRISQRKKLVLIGYLKIVLKVLAILRCDESGRDDGDAKTKDRYRVLDRDLTFSRGPHAAAHDEYLAYPC
jgi:hypothetical protein